MSYFNVFLVSLILSIVSACMPLGSGGSNDDPEVNPNIEPSTFELNAAIEGNFLIQLGEELRLQINVSQFDGGNLTFKASNLPDWISINSENGMISGTPTQSDIGLYKDIRVQILNEDKTHTMGPYSIEVVESLHGFSINWEPVTLNMDDVEINNISSYIIEWTHKETSKTNIKHVKGQMSNQQVVDRLKAGTYEVSMKSVLTSGLKSDSSIAVEITLGSS